MRKGRCSNDPSNCTLARSKTELPYAGIDSVCPECGSPLAAIASNAPTSPFVAASPSVQSPPPSYASTPPRYEQPTASQSYPRASDYQESLTLEPERKDSAMRLTQMVIVGAAIALIGFFAWRMFLQPRPVTAPEQAGTLDTTGDVSQQVTQISPAQLRRISVTSDALSAPNASGTIVAQLPAGSVLDVTGQIQVNGITWMRVTLPNNSSKSGFVREDQMANLGDPSLSMSPMDPLTGTAVSPIVPEVIGPVQAREPSTVYIASRQANIRQEANATSAKVGTFEFKDPITIVAQRSVGPRIWYQVQLPSGGTGWISGRLVSDTPRETAIDSVPAALGGEVTRTPPKPNVQQDTSLSDTGNADNQAAMTAVGPGTTMRVDSSIANLRKEPGATGNSIVEVLARDTLMSVEDVRIVNGVPWYRVTSPNGAQGWVSGRTVVANK